MTWRCPLLRYVRPFVLPTISHTVASSTIVRFSSASQAAATTLAANSANIAATVPTPTPPSTTSARCSASSTAIRKLVSAVDDSINYIHLYQPAPSTATAATSHNNNHNNSTTRAANSYLEARYVRRSPQYVSVYLSSHTGCRMGCQFCWLTAQNQTSFHHVDLPHYLRQLHSVLRDVPDPPPDRHSIRVNVNLMARGEALANRTMVHHYDELYDAIEHAVVNEHGFGGGVRINCSTIMPYTVRGRSLAADVFKYRPVSMSYSLYSIKPHFRRKWMPNAMPAMEALDQLKQMQLDYQQHAASTAAQPLRVPQVNFHWAFIAGENDNEADVLDLLHAIKQRQFINSKFNLVRFNAHPRLTADGYRETEPAQLQRLFGLIAAEMNEAGIVTQHSRIVPRTGPDVYASCGMFVDNAQL